MIKQTQEIVCENEPVEEPLPDWALAKADPHIIKADLQLYTRDGSKVGNAVVIDIQFNIIRRETLFIVVTEAGSLMKLNLSELLFYYALGNYIIKDHLPTVIERAKKYLYDIE